MLMTAAPIERLIIIHFPTGKLTVSGKEFNLLLLTR
jgi:hypothetical protein